VRTEERKYTQAELIQRALDMEEKNITDHRNYLQEEEERRRKAKVVRKGVEGPVLRWISKAEDLPIPTTNDPSATSMTALDHHSLHETQPSLNMDGQTNGTPEMPVSPRDEHPPSSSKPSDAVPSSLQFLLNPAPDDPSQLRCPSPPPPAPVKLEKVTKNYLVHELSQSEDSRKPNWRQTMEALFGAHVRWDELRVYVGKGRPLSMFISCGIHSKYSSTLDRSSQKHVCFNRPSGQVYRSTNRCTFCKYPCLSNTYSIVIS
jgi:hypothetical protein